MDVNTKVYHCGGSRVKCIGKDVVAGGCECGCGRKKLVWDQEESARIYDGGGGGLGCGSGDGGIDSEGEGA